MVVHETTCAFGANVHLQRNRAVIKDGKQSYRSATMHTGKFVVLVLVLLGVIAGVLVWQLGPPQELTYPQAVAQLNSLLKRVSWSESPVTRQVAVTMDKAS